jgi:riboflavin kinase/FMN adenylyltransferase
MLTTIDQRAQLLGEAGADEVLVLPFTHELAALSPAEFVDDVLVDRLAARAVVVGSNFRFGSRASGTVATLTELGRERGFVVEGVDLAAGPGVPWSSTYIRELVARGEVGLAATALGRWHSVEGPVVHGDHRGRGLGYPTANLDVDPAVAVPGDGVYAGWLVRADGERLPAAVSIGTNPTFDGQERRVEAYVLDRDDLDLYAEQVSIAFVQRLRPTLRFDDVSALQEQMAADVGRVRALVAAPESD